MVAPLRMSHCASFAGLALLLIVSPARAQQQAAQPAAAEPRFALVIGNSGYKESPLANPVNDARDMAVALAALRFKVVIKEDADRSTMRQAIRDFGNALIESRGVGLFYFAGHGMQVKGRNFLIPVGEDIQAEDEVEDQSVSIDLVLDKMESAKNRVNIVILDACRNNPFQRRFRSGSRGLAPIDAARGTFIAFATAPGSVAADGLGRNGTFTKHLLESLRHPDTAIETVFKRVRVGVLEDTKERQIPWESSSLTGDFLFNPLQRTEAAALSLAPAPAADTPLAVEIAYWQSIQGSRSQADFDAYLKRYPQGQFAELARNRADALGRPAQVASAAASSSEARVRGLARVVFFRQRGFVGSILNYRIEHNGKPIGNLGNGAYFTYDAPPGQQSFAPIGNFGRGHTFTLEPDRTYYVELNVIPFSASFELVETEYGEGALRSLR